MSAQPFVEGSSPSRRIPELDGLRGLAVVAVVAYHAWPEVVPGGWLGVSVFFTLSGFLITGILIREHEPNRRSLGQFWAVRARRLLPVALLAIVFVVVATALIEPDSMRRVAGDALASIGYVQNWREAAAPGGYGAIFDSGLRPLAHMWSLSIEEQAYVLLPLLTLWLGPRRMLIVGGAVAVAGTVLWWGSPDAYYATPVRLIEVLAGAALAIWLAEGRRVRVPGVVGLAAAALLLLGVAFLSESHGLVSRGVLPVAALLSVAVIATVQSVPVPALCGSTLRWFGHRSYAIYLFHWPLLVLLDAPAWIAVVVAAGLAEVSHRLLEWPIRSQRITIRRPAVTFVTATLTTAALAGGAFVLSPRPASDAEIAAATAAALAESAVAREVAPATATGTVPQASAADVESPTPTTPTAPVLPTKVPAISTLTTPIPTAPTITPVDDRIAVPAGPTVMILGDSTADAIQPAVSGWVAVIGGVSIDAGRSGCSPMFTVGHNTRWYTNLVADPTPCRMAVPTDTDVVLVFDHGVPLFDHFDREADGWTDLVDAEFVAEMAARYEDMIAEADLIDATVVFTTPPIPWPAFGEWPGYHTGTEIQRRLNYVALVTELSVAHDNVHVLDFGSVIDDDPDRYPREDGMHLDAETGAVHAVVDLIAPAFRLAES